MKERELYVNETLSSDEESSGQRVDSPDVSKDRHRKIGQIDDYLKEKRLYVEIHECVLEALEKTPESR